MWFWWLNFFDKISRFEFIFSERVDVGNGFVVSWFVDEFDFVVFNVFNSYDVEFGEEVEG